MSTQPAAEHERQKQAASLQFEIFSLEREIDTRYCRFGKQLFEAASTHVDAINQLTDRLIDAKRELARLNNIVVCEFCGCQNEAAGQFCKNCGEKIRSAG